MVRSKTPPEILDVFYVDIRRYSDPPRPPTLETARLKVTEKLFIVTSRNWYGQSHYPKRDQGNRDLPPGFSRTPREAWERYAGGKEAEISGLLETLDQARMHLAAAKEKLKEWEAIETP